MFCSTIIPTINRPTLSRTVNSVLQQDFPKDQFEVIVVNDSGQALTQADWQLSPQVRVIDTNRRERSVARNAGAALAKGKYLHFLDDDDWMMPGAFKAMWDLSIQNDAAWLYGGFRFVDNSGNIKRDVYLHETGNCLIQLMSGEWLPIQATFIMADPFFSVGGFADLPSLEGGFEDQHLSRMINYGFELAFTPVIIVSIRTGLESSTTEYRNASDQMRRSREKILDLPGSFSRMLSATFANGQESPPFWQGRLVYLYLASIRHNLFRERRIFTAFSRGVYMGLAVLLAGKNLVRRNFWRGIQEYYRSPSFR
jgi:glycosyltransferase involved in cell wall biosynthesis